MKEESEAKIEDTLVPSLIKEVPVLKEKMDPDVDTEESFQHNDDPSTTLNEPSIKEEEVKNKRMHKF